MHPHGEHQHRESNAPEKRDRRVRGVHGAQHFGANQDAGDDLADHHGYKPSSRYAQQRAAEPGEHDHKESLEAHGALSLYDRQQAAG